MTRANISVPLFLHREMRYHKQVSDINWSEVCRDAIQRKINQLDKDDRS